MSQRPVVSTQPFVRPVPGPPPRPAAATLSPAPATTTPDLAIEFLGVTGPMAVQWLAEKASNRNVRKGRVVEFARDMLANNWHPTGEAIKFDTTGAMVDGQHRCEAVALAAKTKPDIVVNMLVVRNVPPEAQAVMDTNTRRTAADQLKIAGYGNYAMLSAAAKWCVIWDRKVLYADRMLKSVTHAEILDYVKENPQLQEICNYVMNRLNAHIDMPSGYIGTGYYVCWRIAPDEADEFFARLADGVMLDQNDPILALRNRLRDLKADRSSLPGDLYLSLLFRSWNARRLGKKVHKLQVYKDKMPIKCPDPI